MLLTNVNVREQVREHYAEHARNFGSNRGCCGSSDSCCGDETIPAAALSALRDPLRIPDEIVRTSLGCGTPLELAALNPGETVLDLGSGGGLDCFYAARLVGTTGRVIGVDMTPEMLALAKENRQKVGLTNVEFRQGYLEALPVDDASVDVIISNCVINLAADKDIVFREAFRVLKLGGRVAFSDLLARVPFTPEASQNIQSWAECVAGAIPRQDYTAKMSRAGFRQIQVIGAPSDKERVYSAKITAIKPK